MEFGIIILGIIIILNLIIVYYVFKIGVQHDSHHEIKTVEASNSVMTLRQRAEDYNRKLAAREAAKSPSLATANEDAAGEETAADAQVSNQLGDEEERQKRREAALKRKAERQASRTTQTEGE